MLAYDTSNLPAGFSLSYLAYGFDPCSFDLILNGVKVASGNDVKNPELSWFASEERQDYLRSVIAEKREKDEKERAEACAKIHARWEAERKAEAAAAEQAIEDHLAGNVRKPKPDDLHSF